MEYLTISKFSVVSPMLSNDGVCVKESAATKLREIKSLCKENVVEIHFFDDKVRIIGKHNRLTRVPQKCRESSDVLCDWLRERISLAW